jgi:5-methylthioadenosine/S-adenosylhomocysteine deaminase
VSIRSTCSASATQPATQPANVDTVMVDGRILKRGGRLTHLDAERIAREAGEANAELRKRANWW